MNENITYVVTVPPSRTASARLGSDGRGRVRWTEEGGGSGCDADNDDNDDDDGGDGGGAIGDIVRVTAPPPSPMSMPSSLTLPIRFSGRFFRQLRFRAP